MNRNEFPPGGWRYYQKETKWNAPHPDYDSFDETVTRIQNHRLANLSYRLTTDRDKIGLELEDFTRARLKINPVAPFAPVSRPKPKGKKCGGCGK